jgi:FkbM family methyltransferase
LKSQANPGMATILRSSVADNALSNITAAECLDGSCSREAVEFYSAPPDKFEMGSVGPQFDRPPILLSEVALDELLDDMGIGDVDVIKLDFEGSELGILQGLTRRLTASRFPKVLFEFCDRVEERVGGQQPGPAQALLHLLGYRTFRLRLRGESGVLVDQPMSTESAMLLSQRSDA